MVDTAHSTRILFAIFLVKSLKAAHMITVADDHCHRRGELDCAGELRMLKSVFQAFADARVLSCLLR